MKRLSMVLSLVVVVSILVACGPTPEPEVVEKVVTQIVQETVIVEGTPQVIEKEVTRVVEVEKEVTAVPEPEEEKILVIGLSEDTVSLDPARSYEWHATSVHHSVYETLTTFLPERLGEVVPGLAESWTISDDGLVYTFTLEEGRAFSTGRPVTADDVVFSINRVQNLKDNPAFLTDNIASVEAVDDRTVVITQKEPDPSLLAKLVFSSLGILDSEEAKAHGATDAEDAAETDTAEEWLNNNSLGSGPYVLQKWEPTVEAILVRNPEWSGAPGFFDKVIYRTMPEAAAQKLTLEAGDIHTALDVSAEMVPSLKENPDIEVYEAPGPIVFFLLMNMDADIGGPLSEDAVQDAVRLAIDYDGMRLLGGDAAATPVNIMPVHWAYALDPSEVTKRDPAAAKAKLAEAGYGDGLAVDLEYPDYTWGGVAVGTLAQKVQADLAEAGITVRLVPMEVGVALEKYRTGQHPFGLWVWGPDFVDPIDRLSFGPGGKVGLRANWPEEAASPELVAVLNQAKVATDPAEREAAFTEIQQIMKDESPFVFLIQPGVQVAYSTELDGFVYTSTTLGRVDPYALSWK